MIALLLACFSPPVDTQMDVEVRDGRVWFEGDNLGPAINDKGHGSIQGLYDAALVWAESDERVGLETTVVVVGGPDEVWRRVLPVLRTLDQTGNTHTHLGLTDGPMLPLTWDVSCHHARWPQQAETLETGALVKLEENGIQAQAWFGVVGEDTCVRPWSALPEATDCLAMFPEGELRAACIEGDGPFRVDVTADSIPRVMAIAEPVTVALAPEGGVTLAQVLEAAKQAKSAKVSLGQGVMDTVGIGA
ncbi:MAG: hypothetical protein GY884_36445, partial [Proteobacteria bacterium]|nr:hypothetical protein [Pseudomonadota bacterium]